MQIETIEVAGFIPALRAMRNPMDSWGKSDSEPIGGNCNRLIIGDADKELSKRLQKAGTEHCKHLRMVIVWADIKAPRYWWNEFDTYRMGVEKVSCSTMHTITKKPFDSTMFSGEVEPGTVHWLEVQRQAYLAADTAERKAVYWRCIIENLPNGFIQRRTVMMSYAALRSIYRQREGHKLKEWKTFREWAENLPENWMITED